MMLFRSSVLSATLAAIVYADTDANGALMPEDGAAVDTAASETTEKPAMDGKVWTGEGDNYEAWAAQFPHLLVEFMAPWCGHCKKLKPEFEQAAEMLHAAGLEVPLVEVDATADANQAGAAKYDVKGYPSLKWFENGVPTDYDGPREAQGIVDWIKTMTGPAVIEGEPTGEEKLAVVYYGEDASVFSEVAKANRKKAQWFHVKSSDTAKITLKHAGDEAVETTDTASQESIETFYKDNSLPKFGELNGETFADYMEAGKGLVWALPQVEDKEKAAEEVSASIRDMYLEVAAAVGPDYAVAWVNTSEFGQVVESMFGLKEFPAVVVQTKAGDKKNYMYAGEIAAAPLIEYVTDVKAGKVEAHLKSEPTPEEPQAEPVKIVVGNTVESMVFTENKDVMLEVYAPWCGHCKKLDPEFLKVARKVEKEGFSDILSITKMDGTLNDSPVDSLEWSGFPTLFYVKAGNAEPMKYDGPRDAKGMWKWIKKNHSQADVIKAKLAENKAAKKAVEEAEKGAEEASSEEKQEL